MIQLLSQTSRAAKDFRSLLEHHQENDMVPNWGSLIGYHVTRFLNDNNGLSIRPRPGAPSSTVSRNDSLLSYRAMPLGSSRPPA